MDTPTIHFNINGLLETALQKAGIRPDSYGPAYEGESVALDLYNASDRAIYIPPVALADSGEDNQGDPNYWVTTRRLIPTGLRVVIPKGWGGFVEERGSVTKTPLFKRAGVIDPGYSDEIFVNPINLHPSETYRLDPWTKTPFQLVFKRVNTNLKMVDAQTFEKLHAESKRNEGKIGSSD